MRLFLYIVLYILIKDSLLMAQIDPAIFSLPVSLTVSKPLIINKKAGTLDFGVIFSTTNTQTLTKSPETGVLFEVKGIVRERIIVNYSNNIVLDNSEYVALNGGNISNITFRSNVQHTSSNSSYVNPKKLRDGGRIRLGNDNGIGKLYIWVGGDLEIQASQPIGDYKGSFNITVAY